MESYGWSIWLVILPTHKVANLIRRNNPESHTPHVTLQTNLPSLADAQIELSKYRFWTDIITIKGKTKILPNHYDTDPLHSWGFDVDLREMRTGHKPHLTIAYSKEKFKEYPDVRENHIFRGRLRIADTRSENPWEWSIVT